MNTYSLKEIGERITSARKAMKITQEELAAKLSITPQAISKWERGTGLPDISILPSLAEALGISVGELFGETAKETEVIPDKFDGLPLVASSKSIGCYSDKKLLSADESHVEFTDGSIADYATQTVTNRGAGEIRVVEFDDAASQVKSAPTTLDTELDYFENLDITLSNCCNVEIVGAEDHKRGIFASGSQAFISSIDYSLHDGSLQLSVRSNEDNSKKDKNKLTIYTGLTNGGNIKMCANSENIVTFGIPFKSADITVSGEADIFANNIDTFSLTINGIGNVQFGCAVTLNARINGVGDIAYDCVGGGSATVTISGSGHVKGGFTSNPKLQINGVGEVLLREVSGVLSLDVNGTGDVKCGGETDNLCVTVDGVGKIDLKQLETRNARIDLGGVAKMDLGKVTGQSVERISKRSSLCVLGRGE